MLKTWKYTHISLNLHKQGLHVFEAIKHVYREYQKSVNCRLTNCTAVTIMVHPDNCWWDPLHPSWEDGHFGVQLQE